MSSGDPVGTQIPLPFRSVDRSGFEQFHAGANSEAVRQLERIATGEQPGNMFVWGDPGAGKTHLLNAVCNRAAQSGRQAALVPLHLHESLSPAMLNGLDRFEIICVDDLDRIAGRTSWEDALFHLYNRMREQGHSLVTSALRGPLAVDVQLPDLKSRLSSDLGYRIAPLDESSTRVALRQRAAQRGIELGDDVLDYLTRRVARDTHTLFGWLDQLDSASLAAKKKLTVPFVRRVLERPDPDS